MKKFFRPHRILLYLVLSYAIWFATVLPKFSGNLRWANCAVFGAQVVLALVYAGIAMSRKIPDLFVWGTLFFWAAGSAFLPYYGPVYFFNLRSDVATDFWGNTLTFLMGKPSVRQLLAHSSQTVPNAVVQSAGLVLFTVGFFVKDLKKKKSL